MPHGLKRFQQTGHLHFITFSCHHRLPYLATPDAKHTIEQVLEHTRETHLFDLRGYVLMPEHVTPASRSRTRERTSCKVADQLSRIATLKIEQLRSGPGHTST